MIDFVVKNILMPYGLYCYNHVSIQTNGNATALVMVMLSTFRSIEQYTKSAVERHDFKP